MSEWRDDWPDWHDSGARVEIELDDGRVIAGQLRADDVIFDGTDESPIFGVHDADGARHSFADMKRWRLISGPPR